MLKGNPQELTHSFKPALLSAFLALSSLLAAVSVAIAPQAHADIGKRMFEDGRQCREALEEMRKDPGIGYWATKADCHWHPELNNGEGIWWMHQ